METIDEWHIVIDDKTLLHTKIIVATQILTKHDHSIYLPPFFIWHQCLKDKDMAVTETCMVSSVAQDKFNTGNSKRTTEHGIAVTIHYYAED